MSEAPRSQTPEGAGRGRGPPSASLFLPGTVFREAVGSSSQGSAFLGKRLCRFSPRGNRGDQSMATLSDLELGPLPSGTLPPPPAMLTSPSPGPLSNALSALIPQVVSPGTRQRTPPRQEDSLSTCWQGHRLQGWGRGSLADTRGLPPSAPPGAHVPTPDTGWKRPALTSFTFLATYSQAGNQDLPGCEGGFSENRVGLRNILLLV